MHVPLAGPAITAVACVCRSFDQFANLVLERAVELITVGNLYAEIALGLYVVRGENVVLLGEIDPNRETPENLQQVAVPPSLRVPACSSAALCAVRCAVHKDGTGMDWQRQWMQEG